MGTEKKLKKNQNKKINSFISPMLARQTDKPFDDNNWIFEIKWNGYRAISEIKANTVTIYSRNGKKLNDRYPAIATALKKLNHDALIDGEIVVLDKAGKSDFKKLQEYDNGSGANLCFYAFDLLSLNGRNITHLPLLQRKELLQKLLKPQSAIKFSGHINGQGTMFFTLSNANGHEGIMAKNAKGLYHAGKRTADWLKIKQYKTQEAIIAGFTETQVGSKLINTILLASKNNSGLKYEGIAQVAIDDELTEGIYNKLQPSKTKKNPFKN